MTTPYEVPAEMRDFAERSVAQARKAFEGFMGAVHKTSGQFDTSAVAGVKDVSSKAVTFAEANVTSAFDLAEKLVHGFFAPCLCCTCVDGANDRSHFLSNLVDYRGIHSTPNLLFLV